MRKLLVLIAFMGLTQAALAEDYVVDDYMVIWNFGESGDASVSVNITQDRSFVQIRRGSRISSSLMMTPEQAVMIGEALESTNRYYAAHKDKGGEIQDKVAAGDFSVTFSTNKKYGFYVLVSDDTQYSEGIVLQRKHASGIAQALRESVQAVGYLQERLDF